MDLWRTTLSVSVDSHPGPRTTRASGAAKDPVYVGLDLGTSSLKGVALTVDGRIVARGLGRYPTRRARPGWAEQEPADWLDALHSVVGQLAAVVPSVRWAGIGLAGMIPTLVIVDGAGSPTGAAVTWEDSRAEELGRRLRSEVGETRIYAETGQWVDGRYLLPMLAWLVEHDPARAATARTVLGAKDYLFLWLTGRYATDPSTATGFGCYDLNTGAWDPELARAAGLKDPGMLPAVLDSATAVPLGAGAAAALGMRPGIPVVLGGADSVLGLLGMGATDAGSVACIWGSSCVVMGISERQVRDSMHRYLVTPLAGIAGWGLEMDLVSAGSAVGWLAAILNLGERVQVEPAEELLALAAAGRIGAGGVSFLPFLGVGEQGARWDPLLRGCLFGLSLAHGPAELARALVEGIMLESRRCLDVLEEAGLPRAPIGVAAAPGSALLLSRLLAEATGRDAAWSPSEPPYSAVGAALLAAAGTGQRIRATWPCERVTADPAAVRAWSTLALRHESLVRWAHEIYTSAVE
jgi:gluconokinase/xylulokinase